MFAEGLKQSWNRDQCVTFLGRGSVCMVSFGRRSLEENLVKYASIYRVWFFLDDIKQSSAIGLHHIYKGPLSHQRPDLAAKTRRSFLLNLIFLLQGRNNKTPPQNEKKAQVPEVPHRARDDPVSAFEVRCGIVVPL